MIAFGADIQAAKPPLQVVSVWLERREARVIRDDTSGALGTVSIRDLVVLMQVAMLDRRGGDGGVGSVVVVVDSLNGLRLHMGKANIAGELKRRLCCKNADTVKEELYSVERALLFVFLTRDTGVDDVR